MNHEATSAAAKPASAPPRALAQFLAATALFAVGDKIHGANFATFFRDRGVSFGAVGMAFGAIGLVTALTDLPSGALADRHGRKRVACAGLAAYGLGLLALALSRGPATVLPGAALVGLGTSLWSGSFTAWFKSRVGDDRARLVRGVTRAQTLQWLAAAGAGGLAFLALPLGGAATFVLGGAIMLAGALALYVTVPENYGDRHTPTVTLMRESLATLAAPGPLRTVLGASLLADVGFATFMLAWQPIWLREHPARASLGLVYVGLMAAAALGAALTDRAASRWRAGDVVALGCLLEGLGLAAMAGVHGTAGVLAGFALFEVGTGFRMAGFGALFMLAVPESRAASVFSAVSTVGNAAGLAAFVAVGALLDVAGPATVLVAAAVTVLCTGSALAFGGVGRRGREPQQAQQA